LRADARVCADSHDWHGICTEAGNEQDSGEDGAKADPVARTQEHAMQTHQPSLFARNDTLLGVCEAIGEDIGFNPIWLRVGFACGVFFNFAATVGVYLALGAVVLASRLIYRSPRKMLVRRPMQAAQPAGAGTSAATAAAPAPALAVAA
jgi:phage shock protein PspC (stress-responsive transcriptional regulator)